jgi:AcrR family transcriptional regulator
MDDLRHDPSFSDDHILISMNIPIGMLSVKMPGKPRRQPRAERRQETRERLLAAATRVFARRGYHAASLDEIASEAGFTKGALYYNFASKEELFLALLDQHIESRIQLLHELAGRAAPAEARLSEGADRTVSSLREEREWSLLYLEFSAYAARNARFRRKFEQRLRAVHEAMVQTVEALAGDPSRLPLPADTLARGIGALVDGVAFGKLLQPRAIPDELLGQMLGLLWRGAAAPQG